MKAGDFISCGIWCVTLTSRTGNNSREYVSKLVWITSPWRPTGNILSSLEDDKEKATEIINKIGKIFNDEQ